MKDRDCERKTEIQRMRKTKWQKSGKENRQRQDDTATTSTIAS